MNIVFINYDRYSGCSGVHIHFLANALADRGHRCLVLLPSPNNDDEYFGKPCYATMDSSDALHLAQRGAPLFRNAVLHAWTPRERVRIVTEGLAAATGRPYFVHLEDNERYILEKVYKAPFERLYAAAKRGHVEISPNYCHPVLHQRFLEGAAGVTCIIEGLRRFVPADVPSLVFWPACEDAFFRLSPVPNLRMRAQLGIAPEATVLVYPGNFHFANAHVMQELYLALDKLAEWGRPVRLIRAGGEYAEISPEAGAARDRYVTHVGHVKATALPGLIGMADILVQPGVPGPFDDCRFPSKLPFFLASGRPVITSPANLGLYLKHGEHCLFLTDSSAEDIARNVIRLMDDAALARRLGENGRDFARRYLSWDKSAARVEAFYQRLSGDEGGRG